MYRIFLSSGDGEILKKLRDRVEKLVYEVFDAQLREADAPVRLEIDRWEEVVAQLPPEHGRTNDIFVEKALKSTLTLVVLTDELRPGTKEELEAVLALEPPGPQLAVLRFDQSGEKVSKEMRQLDEYLEKNKHRFFYKRHLGPIDSEAAWFGLIGPLVAVLAIGLVRDAREDTYRETRP
jgi:hypothetical protein